MTTRANIGMDEGKKIIRQDEEEGMGGKGVFKGKKV